MISKKVFIAVIIAALLVPAGLLSACAEPVTPEPTEPAAYPEPETSPPAANPSPEATPESEPSVTSEPAATPEPEAPSAESLSYAIVDTGQDECYNNSSVITAPSPGSAFYGQDAQHEGNQPSYTLSADGLTVYDNVTGLTWTQGADWSDDGVVNIDDKFTFDGAQDYAETLNARNYGGFSDWRVPSTKELYSLIDYRGTDPNPMATGDGGLVPFIDDDVFEFAYGDMDAGERVIDSQWVTTTLYNSTVMNNTTAMFGVNFADGRIKGHPVGPMRNQPDGKLFYARFCRGNTAYGQNDFGDNGDGTVTDAATGLMWSQSDSGAGMDWEDALAWVQQKNEENYLGYSDWRLPDAKELQGLVDYTRSPDKTGSAAISPLFESSQITDEAGQKDYPFYWSGTTFLRFDGSGSAAVYVAFGEGLGSMDGNSVIDVHGAGCQRSDPKTGNPADYPSWGHGPQGDVQRVFNYVRCVRTADTAANVVTTATATTAITASLSPAATAAISGSADGGLTLFAPVSEAKAYLIDEGGDTVHEWRLSGTPGLSVYLLDGSELLATYTTPSAYFQGQGVDGGGIELLDWDGTRLWNYELSDATYCQHHDIELLPSGNILAVAWEKIPASEATAAGVAAALLGDYGEVWSEAVFEINPETDETVWEWHVWDHLLPSGSAAEDYPGLVDPNYPAVRHSADWLHINAVDYNAALDQIMLSVHNNSEIWIIDHNTTTVEAAGELGDILYRWGNPAAYGVSVSQVLFGQHDAAWIDPNSASSNILLFNNGNPRQRPYSNVLELDIYPYSYGEAEIAWEYGSSPDDEAFFSDHISGVQRLDNGNTLICSGAEAWFFEVTPDGAKVWEYRNTYGTTMPGGRTVTDVFRAERYSRDIIPEA